MEKTGEEGEEVAMIRNAFNRGGRSGLIELGGKERKKKSIEG